MGIDIYEEGRKIGQLTEEMSCTLQIVKKLKEMGFSIKQVLQTIELPESAVLQVFDGKEDIRKIAEDTVNQRIAENGGKIPQERDFINLIGNHHTYSKIDDVDFQILVEADFLVNIFEDGMTREQIESIKQKYFKTNAGLCFLNSMYCK